MTTLPDGFLNAPFAHRGYHDATTGCMENSRAAFLAAIEAGYAIELDVQLSSDGHAMVFHDYDMKRLTGIAGPIRMRTRAELINITLSGCAETIPTLPEVLSLVDGRVPLLIELKDQDGAMGQDIGPLENSVADALENYTGPAAVMGFNPHSIAILATLIPHIPRGLVTGPFPKDAWLLMKEEILFYLRGIPDYDRIGACFISHRFDDLNTPRVKELKASGAHIICWTIRNADEEQISRGFAEAITFEGYAPNLA